jgi:hypothetical protein
VRRLFWLTVGATAGVAAVRKITKTAHAFTPAGLASRTGGLGEAFQAFADQVKIGMVEREAELRDALGLDDRHDLPADQAADLVEHPTRPINRRSSS